MASKSKRKQVILNSTESGHSYHTTKGPEVKDKIEIVKFDPVIRKHVAYKEKK